MLAGHFATALVADQKFPKGTLLYFLIACQLQDLAWFAFHYMGLEPTGPADVLDASLSNMTVNMLYSHDLLPQMFWVILVYLGGKIIFKNNKIALVGVILVIGHFVLDLFSGHPHHIFGEESKNIGLGLYATNVYLAIVIEIVFIIIALWYFFKEETKNGFKRDIKNKAAIIGLFIFGIGFLLVIATNSFRQLFNIPDFNPGFNSNVPTLILTYIGMIYYLKYFVSKPQNI